MQKKLSEQLENRSKMSVSGCPEIKKYKNIIFDCDGVIFDSNKIKEENISKASNKYLNQPTLFNFIEHFNSNPGIPRENKIRKFVPDELVVSNILKEYNALNLKSLKKAKLVNGFNSFIQTLNDSLINKYVISGGDQVELKEVLKYKKLSKYFNEILGGPKTKYQNIDNLNIVGKTLYFGDSKLDYEVCEFYNFDFVFIIDYTEKEIVFQQNSRIRKFKISNFSKLNY